MRAIPTCGTRGGYYRHRRAHEPACQPCTTAASDYAKAYNAQRRAEGRPFKHGTTYGYNAMMCHCDACLEAQRIAKAKARRRDKGEQITR